MVRLLIIEDDELIGNFYRRLFSSENYQVDLALDGETGLDLVKQHKPDLVLLDIVLPRMSGLDVLKSLRDNPDTHDCRVLVLSNISDGQIMGQAMALGIDGFIVKSTISPEALKKEIEVNLQTKDVTVK